MPKRGGRKKDVAKYEDLDDRSIGPVSINNNEGALEAPEIELTSVSVIPDGMYSKI